MAIERDEKTVQVPETKTVREEIARKGCTCRSTRISTVNAINTGTGREGFFFFFFLRYIQWKWGKEAMMTKSVRDHGPGKSMAWRRVGWVRMYRSQVSECHRPIAWIWAGGTPEAARKVAPPARIECPPMEGAGRRCFNLVRNHFRVGGCPELVSHRWGWRGKRESRA
jgi:hypothetical protein